MSWPLRWLVLAILTGYGLWMVPGSTYLLSDTQIYVPMLDRISDPTFFTRELVAQRQHLSLTIYDETALAAKWISGLDYESILGAMQALSRLLGLYGLLLVATAMGLAEVPAMLIPAVVGLGTAIHGPAVLTVELEPVPRGIAVMLSLLALGLAMHGRNRSAGLAGGVAFLFHAPAVVPFLVAFALFQLWQRDLRPLSWILAAVVVSVAFAVLQPGVVEKQQFFSQIDPDWEKLQRMRASYNWLGMWKPWFFWNFAANGLVAALALARIWKHLGVRARFYALALPLIGLLSLPLGWLLMEHYKWALMAQVQPARSVLFTVVMALTLSIAAALFALRDSKWIEAALWLVPAMFTVLHGYLWESFAFPLTDLQMTGLAICAAMLAGWFASRKLWASGLIVAVAVLTGWLRQDVLKRSNYTPLENADLTAAARWTRENTAKDAMFLLPELARSGESGIFRVRAQRALFVDWKIGGQVNYSRELSFEWWRRMQLVDDKKRTFESWRSEGVDYVVLKAPTPFASGSEVFRNARYAIYKIR